MVRRIAGTLAVLVLLAAAGGCAQTSGVIASGGPRIGECAGITVDDQKVTDATGAPHPDLIEFLVKGLAVDPTGAVRSTAASENNPFDAFLDCYVGEVDATNVEQRLLRGHIVVTMLAMYGSYNIGLRRYDRIEDDATAILRSIEAAEVGLGAGSNMLVRAAGHPADLPRPVIPAFARVDRVVDILQVSIDVERPTFNRSREAVVNIVAAIAGSPQALRELVGTALTGIRKVAVLELYGPALRNDARRFLARVRAEGAKVDDWEGWDRHLYAACRPIAELARAPNRCVASAAALREAIARNTFPGRRIGP